MCLCFYFFSYPIWLNFLDLCFDVIHFFHQTLSLPYFLYFCLFSVGIFQFHICECFLLSHRPGRLLTLFIIVYFFLFVLQFCQFFWFIFILTDCFLALLRLLIRNLCFCDCVLSV